MVGRRIFNFNYIKRDWILVEGYWRLPDKLGDLHSNATPDDQKPIGGACKPPIDYHELNFLLECIDAVRCYMEEHGGGVRSADQNDELIARIALDFNKLIATALGWDADFASQRNTSAR